MDNKRRKSIAVNVAGVKVGGNNPVVIQSMTNTDTADVEKTTQQIENLVDAGSQIVRISVDRPESAQKVPEIKEKLMKKDINAPIVGDFHYNGHRLLSEFPQCAQMLDKYRINPGNVGFGEKRDTQFAQIIEIAIKYNKPIRIGVNWGSIDPKLLTGLMEKNAKGKNPKSAKEILRKAIVQSALLSAKEAEKIGMKKNKIILSAKVSDVQELNIIYREIAKKCEYALHLGLTEAGMDSKGIVASAAALALLLQQGIGDTIRVSLTPKPNGDRTEEVKVAQEILQVMGLASFAPIVSACPGCGRTTSTVFQELAQDIQGQLKNNMKKWKGKYEGVENLKVAVMGCIVNGPGESKHADIGISLPGTGEAPAAPVFVDGKKAATLRGENIAEEFEKMVHEYVEKRFGEKN